MWEDEMCYQNNQIVAESRVPSPSGKSKGLSRQWIANLKWARDHCDNLVRLVILKAENPEANPKKILFCYADDSLVMRIKLFDAKTGSVRMESVPNNPV
jgi:hypothetical protein